MNKKFEKNTPQNFVKSLHGVLAVRNTPRSRRIVQESVHRERDWARSEMGFKRLRSKRLKHLGVSIDS